jgi:hypothetical protein
MFSICENIIESQRTIISSASPLWRDLALFAERFQGVEFSIMPSTVIATMRYDEVGRVLTIAFRGGRGTYRYFDVPPSEWASFQNAFSKGTYLNEIFKPKGYRYEKIWLAA